MLFAIANIVELQQTKYSGVCWNVEWEDVKKHYRDNVKIFW